MRALSLRAVTGALFLFIAAGVLAQSAGASAQQPATPKPRALPVRKG